ncbi:MAG TPA: YbaK/EbsC family protein [Angustibacter sp.]|nr:YbaK/EbsC family protein [Angustibacter sp.]
MPQPDDVLGRLQLIRPALSRPDLLAGPVASVLQRWRRADEVAVTEIDADLADTAAMTDAYDVPLEISANCVVVGGRRAGEERIAACVVLATTRADVNNAVRRSLDVRKASFLAMDDAVERTGMEYGGITPVGLPGAWQLLVDARVAATDVVIVGSGVRRSKLVLPGAAVGQLPRAVVVEGLGR